MQTRNIHTAIRELLALLPPQMGPVVERACIENLRIHPQPERSMFRLNDQPHSYGPNSIKICNGAHGSLVFAEMLKDGRCSAPTYSQSPIYTGKAEILFPLNDMVVKYVDQEERSIYNITLPKHIFFPGYVKLVVMERRGATVVDVSGEGTGNWKLPNIVGGPVLFEMILNEHLVPRVKRKLDGLRIVSGCGGDFGGGGATGWW